MRSRYATHDNSSTIWLALCVLAICPLLSAEAQVRGGLRGGVTLTATAANAQTFDHESREYRLSVQDVAAGFHAGLFLQADLTDRLVLQPELLFHSTRTDYLLEEIRSAATIESVRTEKVGLVELPLLFGYRAGPFRLQGGPVGRTRVAQSSELQGLADYRENADWEDIQFGYQVGVGVDIWRFLLDVKYDGSINGARSTVDIAGRELPLSQRASRTYLTVGWEIFGKKRKA